MPIIAVEEDDQDEVIRLLSGAEIPDIKSNATISIETPPCTDEEQKHNEAIDIKGQDPDWDDNQSFGSTFELCSISSCTNLSEYNNKESLNIPVGRSTHSIGRSGHSIGRSGHSIGRSGHSIGRSGRSIGNSTSSHHRYTIVRRAPSTSQIQMNRSIGSSNSSGRKIGGPRKSSLGSKIIDDVIVIPNTEERIDTKYFVDHSREVGRGTKTIVRKCVERSTGNRYAVKSVRRTDKTEYEHMRNEVNLLTVLDHPSIIKIYDTYEDDKFLHIVVDICKGGELYDYVVKPTSTNKKNGQQEAVPNCPSEEVAAVIVRQVVDAVAYLHDHDIVHRDLKLENLLFKLKPNAKNKQSLTEIRVIDFGLSRKYNTHHRFCSLKKLTSFVGTKLYVAPEVLNHSYTHAVDLWSVGVLAYALLSARAPFTGRNDQELFDKIQHCGEQLKFPSPDFDAVSEEAKHFIRSLLVKDESNRPTACELLDHPWMVKADQWKEEIDAAAAADRNASLFKKILGRFGKGKKKSRAKGKNERDHGPKSNDLDGRVQ